MSRTLTAAAAAAVLLLAAPAGARSKPSPAPPAGPPPVTENRLAAIKARAIGPAVMAGRVAAIALDPKDDATFFVGLGTGGAMKTTDAGASFKPIFEKEKFAAIGAIAIAPSDPKIVWVGTGEGNDRNSSSWGGGVYRSEDGGDTWARVGLETSRVIPRIVVHPSDPATAWVAVMGDLWTPTPGRGLYKTTDAGKTWTRVLSAPAPYDDRVGCGDVALDPSDPNVLYAALYARRRRPWSFAFGPEVTDGKDLGGIFKSVDGGATWTKLDKGLPPDTGRIGLDVYAKDPHVVYAVVQSDAAGKPGMWGVRSKSGGVFRSEDGGATWKRMSPLDPRPFYFSQIRVDPQNDKRIYVLGFMMHVSDDGGVTFREDLFKNVHPDCHALVVDPKRPSRLILGTDGGVYQTFDGGKKWDFLNRFAGGEFYRINVDMSTPYRICGGLQDNNNWIGPSRTYSKDGVVNADWTNIGGGDGFSCVFDPKDPNVVYSESQEGYVARLNLANGESKDLRPQANEGEPGYRFHWNAPLIGSAHDPGVLYLGGNRVFKLTDKAEHWALISPDLSAQNPKRIMTVGSGAETYGVVYTLAESPVEAGMLWAGTDDGKLWVTEDEGAHWTDLTESLPAAAKGAWLTRVEPGHRSSSVAYLVVDAHRSGNFAPLVWKTADRGKTWTSIASDLPKDEPVQVVREDPVVPSVLYLGTEFGLYVSLDAGAHWTKFGGLPTVAIDDLVVHPRDHDLVIGTHGRSLYVLDDLAPFEGLDAAVRKEPAHLFPIRAAFGRYDLPGWKDCLGTTRFSGKNPPPGAILSFWVRDASPEPAKIEIKNAEGQTVAKLKAPALPGLGRVSWNLKPTKDLLTAYGGEGDLFVRSGTYEATLTVGTTKSKQSFQVTIAKGIETR